MAGMRNRYGILGTGMIADWLANAFADCARSELVAVASRSKERAAAFARKHSIPSSFGSYESLLAEPDVDAVIIALPNTLHCDWVVEVARAGKHVLCEKPLAMTVAECDIMADACAENGVLLMEAAMYRFQPQMAKVQELIAAGKIGPIRLIRGAFCFPFRDTANIRLSKAMGGGCLFDLGFYPVDFGLLVTGETPGQVSCFTHVGAASGVEEAAAGCLQFPGGAIGLFECGFAVDVKTNADIIGDEATIQLPDPWTARGKSKQVLLVKAREVIERYELPDPNAYTLEIDHFSECITEQREPMLTLPGTRASIATLQALAESAQAGRTVALGC